MRLALCPPGFRLTSILCSMRLALCYSDFWLLNSHVAAPGQVPNSVKYYPFVLRSSKHERIGTPLSGPSHDQVRGPLQFRANPSARTVTSRPGCRNITLATEGEIGFPKRQKRRPFSCWAFAHAANSSGVGGWPISTAHRRTINPSIILGAPLGGWEEPTIFFV